MGGAISRAGVSDLQDRRDRELLNRIAGGSEEALSELYRRYAPVVNGLAWRILGDEDLAEDVVQEVFVSVWRGAGSYDVARGSVRSWILTRAHHRAVDSVRREEAERRRVMREAPAPQDDPIGDVVEESWMADRQVHVRKALGALSADQRQVLELAYYDGMSQVQIAEKIGIPLGTVKTRTFSAMRKLRGVLTRAGER